MEALTFQEKMVAALNAIGSPDQSDGVKFDQNLHSAPFDLPMAVCHLHNLAKELCLERSKMSLALIASIEDMDAKASSRCREIIRVLDAQILSTRELKSAVFSSHFPKIDTSTQPVAILEDWKFALVINTQTTLF